MNAALTWLASFRLRTLFRTAFLALAIAVLAMTITVLQEEKQRSYDNYQGALNKTKEQIVARLHHPAGQLALLNPRRDSATATQGKPVVLPYSAIDFDDQSKVKNAVEMAGCLLHYPPAGSLCVAIGNNPWAGGFIYAAGSFASGQLEAHRIGDEFFDAAHRLRVTVSLRGQTYHWLAPFEALPPSTSSKAEGVRGRFTGYVEQEGRDYTGARPLREFRGWVWQEGKCLENVTVDDENCPKKSFFSLRLPVEVLRDALFSREKPTWPPTDLNQFQVHVEVLPPGEGAALFDNLRDKATPPFTLDSLSSLLLPGETLSIQRADGKDKEIVQLSGREEVLEQSSPLLTRLIRKLPVDNLEAPLVTLIDEVATPLGNYRLLLTGDARSVNKVLSVSATRVSWLVGAMLGAIGLAWLVIEIGIIRRIAILTRRTRGLSRTVHADGVLERYDLSDLRGNDELGILASGLDDLLHRVNEDVEREKIRTEQEKEMWHAVGHEIMSPLQSLLALHGDGEDPSHRYISRMQQAVRVLYGSASPSEAFQSSRLNIVAVDLVEFAKNVAANAGISDVRYVGGDIPLPVRADEFPLEDVFAHVLKNADRYRTPGSLILIELDSTEVTASIVIRNAGPRIPEDLLGRIFEYGVSSQSSEGTDGHRGQGLFVAKTYMAKMGGTIVASNLPDGVRFTLSFQRLRSNEPHG